MIRYEKICVCLQHNKGKSKSFDSYEELIEWAKEEIKNNEIKVGDIVTIEKYGEMFTTLDEGYFEDLWNKTNIGSEEIYKIMIHYDYGCSFGIGPNPNNEKNRIKWKVVFIAENKVFIQRFEGYNSKPEQILCIGKNGLKKFKED